MKLKNLFFVFIIILMTGCVNTQLGDKYYKNHNYAKAYDIYYQYAKKGFPKGAYKVSEIIYLQKNKPAFLERHYALYAYNHGYTKASRFIADSYFRENYYHKALIWYKKTDISLLNLQDFKNYLICINSTQNFTQQSHDIKTLENYILKHNNMRLLIALGDFYLKKSPYYNPEKGIKFLQEAYKDGYYPAGISIAVFYIQSGENEQKGYKILKNLIYTDPNAAYYLANYLYQKMIKKEQLLNNNCISTTFKTPKEFFIKKLTIYKFNDLFMRKNIVKLYKISYNLGNKEALSKLIKLDIKYDNFQSKHKTYSGFNLQGAINYLQNQNNMKADLILATIYTKYLKLNSYTKAKSIYQSYAIMNKTLGEWYLYQYEKQFENKINYQYLNYLANKKFIPAIIEKAYQEALNKQNIYKNRNILQFYAKQNNITALNDLASLYAKNIFYSKNKRFEYYKMACVLNNKPFNMPNDDLKIASFYNKILKKQKALTIYYYYAQMNNQQAQLQMVNFYQQHYNYKKLKYWLYVLRKESNKRAEDIYNSLILLSYISGNYQQALKYITSQHDFYSYVVLGDMYANGYHMNFDPKKAAFYYNKALKLGDTNAIFKLIALYQKINIEGNFNNKIISLYKQAIKLKVNNAKIGLARFYFKLGFSNKALDIIKTIHDYKHNPKARYLTYLITGKIHYINGKESNYGNLLLVEAKHMYKRAPRKALYYTFRAMLCNTPSSSKFSMTLMKRINDSNIINNIFNKAQHAIRCNNR